MTETRTYDGHSGTTNAFDGYKGLHIGQRYTGVPQEDAIVLVAVVGAPMYAGINLYSVRGG